MKLAFAWAATISVSALGCVVDTVDDTPPADDGASHVSGAIAADTTWTAKVVVDSKVTVNQGVTLTVAPGTTVLFGSTSGITVAGTLKIQGSKTSKVVFGPTTTGGSWNSISVPSSGSVTASYLDQTGGVIAISGGKVTLVDSKMALARGDLLTMSGGTLDMSYSQIGLEPGQNDTTHCDLHVANAPSIKLTHSNIMTSSYGIMFYGGNGADFTYNNWIDNGIDVDATPGVVSGDFSHSYFAKGAPTGVGITTGSMEPSRLADAGPR